jgi:penicillin-binding protein 1B
VNPFLREALTRLARAGARLVPRPPGRIRWSPLVLVALGLSAAMVLGLAALATYTAVEVARFDRALARRGTLVHAAAQRLAPGFNVRTLDLAGTLARLGYDEAAMEPVRPGQFHRAAGTWAIYVRGSLDASGERRAARLRLELKGERITHLQVNGDDVETAALEPEVLTSVPDRPGEQYRLVRLADAPLGLLHAVLAVEDHRFFEHRGLDLRGLLRAAWANLRAGQVTQGGSTITQQLVKNRLLGSQRTVGRKLREAWLATIVDARYTKEQIFEAYLNEVYLGQGGGLAIRGMGAAARAYFGKEVHQLSLGEAALLAGMVRAPNSYSPLLNPERARQRRDVVLARMREVGRLSPADYEAARREPVRARAAAAPGQPAPYFTDIVRQELESRLGDEIAGGERVLTTLDLALQRFAEQAVARGLERLEAGRPALTRRDPTQRLQAVLIVLEPSTGHILALVGGRDYQTSQFNRALLARRQPGSAFKPFVYAAALGRIGGSPAFTAATFVEDSPIVLKVGGEPWSPRNYEDRYEGRVTVRRALEQSLNAATVRIALEVGLDRVIATARALGLTSALRPVPAMTLGAFEVTPLELARAYLPLANGGSRIDSATAVRAVREADGAPVALEDYGTAPALSPAEAYVLTALLEGAMVNGTGASARALGVTGSVGGKTGTTNDGRDAWFVGYSRNFLSLVWVGFDSGEPHGLSGAQAALPIWAEFMRQALEAYPAPRFAAPAGVSLVNIDVTNGKVANRFCPVVARETFLSGTEPPPCDEHGALPHPIRGWWRRLHDWLSR